MSEWTTRPLGSAIRVKHGWAFKGEYFCDSGNYLVVTPGNFYEAGGFRLRENKEKYYSGEFPIEYLLNKDDLIIAMTEQGAGLLGAPALIPKSNFALHNQRIGLVSIIDKASDDRRFLYYLLNTEEIRSAVSNAATGTKVKHTSPKTIYRIEAKFPTLEVQQKIASILSAYDDLIENNLRRIKLLEELAQQTYEEWFVRMRFPGYETAEWDEGTGLPVGWGKNKFGKVITLKRGYDLPKAQRIEGAVPILAATGQIGWHNTIKVRGPGITTGRSGSIGEVIISESDFWPLNTALYLKKQNIGSVYFVFKLMQSMELKRLASGSAVPTLDRKVVHAQTIVVPTRDLIDQFNILCESVYSLVSNLQNSSDLAQKIRGFLLPRLMSGEMDIELIEMPEASEIKLNTQS